MPNFGSIVSHGIFLVIGAIGGGFIARRNPLKAAKTLEDLEAAYAAAKARLKG